MPLMSECSFLILFCVHSKALPVITTSRVPMPAATVDRDATVNGCLFCSLFCGFLFSLLVVVVSQRRVELQVAERDDRWHGRCDAVGPGEHQHASRRAHKHLIRRRHSGMRRSSLPLSFALSRCAQPSLSVVMAVPDDRMEIVLFNVELRSLGGTQVRARIACSFVRCRTTALCTCSQGQTKALLAARVPNS